MTLKVGQDIDVDAFLNKLVYMESYPDDFNVKIITGSHSDGAHVIE